MRSRLLVLGVLALLAIGAAVTGCDSVPLPAPSLVASPASLVFGTITVGNNSLLVVQITNNDTVTVTISSYSITSGGTDFAITSVPAPGPLAPSASVNVDITYTPSGAGNHTGNLSVPYTGGSGSPLDVALSGTGQATPGSLAVNSAPGGSLTSGATVTLGSVRENSGGTLSANLTLTNAGGTAISVDSITGPTMSGSATNEYTISAGPTPSLPATLNPSGGNTITLTVTFTEAGKGTGANFNAQIVFGWDTSNTFTINFTATVRGFDFNGDGYEDIIVGAWYASSAYIFLGGPSLPTTIDASVAGVKLTDAGGGGRFGVSVSSAGDVNADGYDDAIVGAYWNNTGGASAGCAYVFFGSASPPVSIDATAADVKLVGGDAGDWFGVSVSTAGDLNGDGFDDVVVGAWYDDDGGGDSGCAFAFFGGSSLPVTIDAAVADVKFVGGDAGDIFGVSVASAGDLDGDGFGDVVIGASHDDDGGIDAGCAFVYLGAAALPSTLDATNAGVRLVGGDAGDEFGNNVSCAGDVNGDGFPDLIVGAYSDDDGGISSGCAFIFFGGSTLPATIDATAANVKLVGGDSADTFGVGVSGAGDMNGDGFADVLIGAWFDDDGGTSSGCAFVFFGGASLPATIDASAANVKLIGADAADQFGNSVSRAGDVNGDGHDDIVVGATYDDDGGVESGCAFVFFGSTSLPGTIDASAASVKLIGEGAGDRFGVCVGG